MRERAFRLTWKDGLILLLLLAVVYIVAQKAMLREQLKMPTRQMEVLIVAESVPNPLVKDIVVGDSIYQKGAMFPFGTIVKKEVSPARRVIADEMGRYHVVYLDEQSDVALTIEAPGFVSLAGSPIIDNTFFYANQYLPAFTDRAVFTSRVIHVRKDER